MGEVADFRDTQADVRSTAVLARTGVQVTIAILDLADQVVDVLKKIDKDAEQLRKVADGLEDAIKLVSKVKFLKPLADPAKTFINQVRKRAQDIEDGITDTKKSDLDRISLAIKVELAALKLSEISLDNAILGIDSRSDSLDDAILGIDILEANLPDTATWVAAIAAADATVASANQQNAAAIQAVKDAVETSRASVESALQTFSAPAREIISIFKTVSDISGSLGFLQGPLNAISAVLQPLEWALDAVDAVFDFVVSPVLDPLLDALGLNKLFQDLANSLNLPTFAPFDDVFDEYDILDGQLSGGIPDFINDITDFTDKLQVEFVDRLTNAANSGAGLVLGSDGGLSAGTSIQGAAGPQIISGGLGDDTLRGGAGDDVLIGGPGDDLLDGEGGSDVAVLLGDFSEWVFVAEQNSSGVVVKVTATHDNVAPGNLFRGVDTIVNVDRVVMADRVVVYQDFANFQYAGLGGETLIGDRGIDPLDPSDDVPSNDYLFGNTGDDTLIGLGLDDYLEGRAGVDDLRGGNNDDWLDGGPGVDLLDGGFGLNDTASFKLDTSQIHKIALTNDASRTPFVTTEDPINIENLSGSINRDWFWGDNSANRLAGEGGDDLLVGFSGNDVLEGGDGNDQLVGGKGSDTVYGGEGQDIFIAGRGSDIFKDDGLDPDVLFYGGGAIPIWTAPFAVTSVTNPGYAGLPTLGFLPADIVSEFPGHIEVDMPGGKVRKFDATGSLFGVDRFEGISRIAGSVGNDLFTGSDATETFWAGSGDDIINGGGTALDGSMDSFDAGDGDDTIDPGHGGASIDAGDGDDLVILDDDGSGALTLGIRDLTLSLAGGAGYDVLDFSDTDRAWSVQGIGGFDARGHLPGYLYRNPDGSFNPNIVWADEEPLDFEGFEELIFGRFDDAVGATGDVSRIYGGGGRDLLEASLSLDSTLHGGDERDDLRGGPNNDRLFGDDGADLFYGYVAGPNVGGGTDTYFGGAGNDLFEPFRGSAGPSVTSINGGPGADVVNLVSMYLPGVGADVSLADQVWGTGFNLQMKNVENLRGTSSGDTLEGDAGSNRLTGEVGFDTLFGLGGDDALYGNDGWDTLDGGLGDDILFGGPGVNTLIGGGGTDTASWDAYMSGDDWNGSPFGWTPQATGGQVNADLLSQRAYFSPNGFNATYSNTLIEIENMQGTWSPDTLRGDARDNVLTGGKDDSAYDPVLQQFVTVPSPDALEGRGGDDVLTGGGGGDLLYGDSIVGDRMRLVYLNEGATNDERLGVTSFTDMPTTHWTIEFMLQRTEIKTDTTYLMSYAVSGTDNEILVQASPGGLLSIRINNLLFETGIPSNDLLDGDLHRFSMTLDTTTRTLSVYVDGVSRLSLPSVVLSPITSGGTLVFGQEQDSVNGGFDNTQIFKGGYGDIRIFDYVRTPSQIAANWKTEISNTSGPNAPVANWKVASGTPVVADVTGGPPLQMVNIDPAKAVRSIGFAGDDTLDGGDGDDMLIGGNGADYIDGGLGFDTADYSGSGSAISIVLDGTAGSGGEAKGDILRNVEAVIGTFANDSIVGNGSANDIVGGKGDDSIEGLGGDDTLNGNEGIDTLSGQGGQDSISGGKGPDTITGGADADTISGDGGLDSIDGGAGSDLLLGGTAADTIRGGKGADEILGGTGNDIIYGEGFTDTIYGNENQDELYGGGSSDTLFGGSGSDTLTGNNAKDFLFGESGGDILDGGAGNDELDGGDGGDTLLGSTGDDRLTGGANADVFQFRANHGSDRILDFEDGTDLIEFDINSVQTINALTITSNFAGTAAIVDYGSGSIRLDGIAVADLDSADFVFL